MDQGVQDGATPLLVSAFKGHDSSLRILLEAGAAVKQAMQDGITPLWLGMWWVHALLLLIGAGLNLPDTAWFLALRYRLAQGRAS